MTTVADVRALQEAAKDKWSSVIREAIIEALRGGSFHADDLEPLGIPRQHRNIIGSQAGYLVSKRYMQEVGRRKSTVPSRKAAKSGVYEFTRVGREKLASLDIHLIDAGSKRCSRCDTIKPVDQFYRRHSQAPEPARPYEPLSLLPEPDPKAWAA